MTRREPLFLVYLRALVLAAVASVMLEGCARNDLDHIYDDSFRHSREITDQESREFAQWQIEHARWLSRAPETAGPKPVLAPMRLMSELNELRMRFMEGKLIELIGARCAGQPSSCAVGMLRRLGFACNDAERVVCTLANTAYGEFDSPIKRMRERHVWTVTMTPAEAVDVKAHVEIANPPF